MASVKFKNIKGVERLVIDRFTELKTEQRTLVEVAQFTKQRIQQQTRLGKSLPTDSRLKGLSAKYKEFRKTARNVDPEFFEPNRSNLTFTGQLLRSLKARIKKSEGTVEVFPSGRRKDGLTNQEVARLVRQNGRPFLGLDEVGTNQIRKIVLNNLRRILRKSFK